MNVSKVSTTLRSTYTSAPVATKPPEQNLLTILKKAQAAHAAQNPQTAQTPVATQALSDVKLQMQVYSSQVSGTDTMSTRDYLTLQTAIQSGDVAGAQQALAKLKRDLQAAHAKDQDDSSRIALLSPPLVDDSDVAQAAAVVDLLG